MRLKADSNKIMIAVGLSVLIFLFTIQNADAAQMSDYCITPPYIGASIEPNLLLMIDNSASMYDLTYTDTSNTYCANAPSKSCTTDSYCAGLSSTLYPAYCIQSATTTTTTTYTLKPCTTNSDCPNSSGSNACSNGFCKTCNTNTGVGDCVATTIVTTTPIPCTSDSQCPGDSCGNKCNVTHMCYDDTYNDAGSYDGLFDQSTYYFNYPAYYADPTYFTYNSLAWFWADYNFFAASSMPPSCTYGGSSSTTPFVCINLDSSGKLYGFWASGKFLNWLTMSKFDIEKKILTGGKVGKTPTPYEFQFLEAETRGCSGRKFIKVVPGLAITFAVRGGSATGGQNILSQASEFGQSYLEIYKGTYDAADCLAAANDWTTNANLGTTQKDTNNCIGGTQQNPALIAANQSIHDCFWYFNGHSLSNLNPIEGDCIKDWSPQPLACTKDGDCQTCPAGYTCNLVTGDSCVTSGATANQCKKSTIFTPPNSITDPNAPDAICSSVLPKPAGNSNSYTGYLGNCYNFSTGKWDDTCAMNMAMDFCQNLGNASQVTDPAEGSVIKPTVQNIPGFVASLGLSNLPMLNDYSQYSAFGGTAGVQVNNYSPTAPTGLIDKYKSMIRFGVMTFQNNGSASECNTNGYCSPSGPTFCTSDSACGSGNKCISFIPCANVCSNNQNRTCSQNSECTVGTSTGTCGPLTKTDGGIITSYIGPGHCSLTTGQTCTFDSECPTLETCIADVGDHTSGLIQRIDNIVASSWTPFAEAFYNAMGYFARTTDYPIPPAVDNSTTATSRSDFNFTGLPASYVTNENPSQKSCQKNNVLIITDGMSTADQNSSSEALASTFVSLATVTVGATAYSNYNGVDTSNNCPAYSGSRSLPVLTWVANHRNIKNLSQTSTTPKHCTNDIFGPTCASDADCGTNSLCTNLPTRSSESIQTWIVYTGAAKSSFPGLCDPLTFMTAAASNGGTSLFQATDVSQLQTTLATAFDQVAARAASGTAASVLASQGKSGANLIQTVFYPHKSFPNSITGKDDEISWIGRMTNLWYWVDQNANTSTIREDNGTATSSNSTPWAGDKKLHLQTDSSNRDYIVQMYYDKSASMTKAARFGDSAGNGVISYQTPTISFEDLGYLWEAGTLLWKRDPSTRNIITSIASGATISFNTANAGSLAPYLNTSQTTTIIKWVTGYDFSGYRSRNVMMANIDTTNTRVWKLGDVINSTPALMSSTALNFYTSRYGDSTYSSFVSTATYTKRGMVFAGGNDGMLHAFKLGTLQFSWSGQDKTTEVARLVDDTGVPCTTALPGDPGGGPSPTCGQEQWAFIPKNVLPYLQYLADPAYCHLYTVDLTPVIFDASIGGSSETADTTKTAGSWRTILIGGMRFGGACKASALPVAGVGYSAYFALDITDQNNPKLMWEFSDPTLGFSTTGPSIVRINGKIGGNSDTKADGHWFVVFGSGPTGPVSTGDHQFLGTSDQNLKLFVLDLKSGNLLNTIDTGIQTAFAGSMVGSALDMENDYQDELVYVPYVKKDTAAGTWTDGGVGRLMTMRDPNPVNWKWNRLIDGVGPVTTAVSKINDTTVGNLWVYFGTGRYYFVQNTASDDPSGQRYFFGLKDPCATEIKNNTACTAGDPAYQWSSPNDGCSNPGSTPSCTSPSTSGGLTNVTDYTKAPAPDVADDPSFKGWYIALEPAGLFTYPPDTSTNFLAERSVNDPLATSSGVIYFTTYKPYTDLCLLSGKSFVWAVQYNTGGAVSNLKGLVMVQSSTGAIQQMNLKDALTAMGGRKSTTAIEGLTGGGPVVQSQPAPVHRVIHIRER